MNTAQAYGLRYDTYGPGYSRHCPICKQAWPTGKMALRCWYLHPEEQGGGKTLARRPISMIADIMGLSEDGVRRNWKYLIETCGAPSRLGPDSSPNDPGKSYEEVVRYIRERKQHKQGLPRGWTEKLAEDLEISRQRVSHLRQQAIARGDL